MLSIIRDTVRKIPRGKVATYGDVARAAGFPGRARQVVWALRSGRGLPWHRVVGAGGRIRLPGEAGLEQRLRLENEGVAFRAGRVSMEQHRFQFRSQKTRSGSRRSSPPSSAATPARTPASSRSGRSRRE